MENLIQQEIIQAVIDARNQGKDIKQTIKKLAKEFALTEFMVKGIIENSALYGLEQIPGPKTDGKIWKPMDYTKAIRKLEDKIYELEAELARTKTRIGRELEIREDPWIRQRLSTSLDVDENIPTKQVKTVKGENRIQELRKKIDEVRALLDEEQEKPRLTFRALKERR